MNDMAEGQFRGIFAIPATPFHEDESLDRKSLESVLHFTVESGCHGVVMPVMASEYQTLTDAERTMVVETAVRVVAGRVPVVAGVTGVSNPHSIGLAQMAQDAGADAVIAMAPHSRPPRGTEISEFFGQLSRAVSVPVFIQNHTAGGALSAGQLADLCRSFDNVRYVKEETAFPGHVTTRLLELAGDACEGVMGGSSCRNVISEYHRGMCGNMPASHFGDPMSRIWELLDSGQEDEAKEVHRRMLPFLNFEGLYGVAAFKEVLVRRGVIASATARSPGRVTLDAADHAEISTLLAEIDDLLTWKKA